MTAKIIALLGLIGVCASGIPATKAGDIQPKDGVLTISEDITNKQYADRDDIEKVILEEGCTKVGDWAFAGCTNLKEVEISDSVTDMGMGVFMDTKIKELTIPDSVTRMHVTYLGMDPAAVITARKDTPAAGGCAVYGLTLNVKE